MYALQMVCSCQASSDWSQGSREDPQQAENKEFGCRGQDSSGDSESQTFPSSTYHQIVRNGNTSVNF